ISRVSAAPGTPTTRSPRANSELQPASIGPANTQSSLTQTDGTLADSPPPPARDRGGIQPQKRYSWLRKRKAWWAEFLELAPLRTTTNTMPRTNHHKTDSFPQTSILNFHKLGSEADKLHFGVAGRDK